MVSCFDKWGVAVVGFSNLLRDSKHVKVANFGLSLPTIDSERVSGQVVANDSFHTKPKGTSCKFC